MVETLVTPPTTGAQHQTHYSTSCRSVHKGARSTTSNYDRKTISLKISTCIYIIGHIVASSSISLNKMFLIRANDTYILPFYTQCFCIVYHHFVHFYVCYWFSSDDQGKRSKEQSFRVTRSNQELKRSNFGQSKIACRGMGLLCRSMRSIPAKIWRPTYCNMPRQCKKENLKACRSMIKTCRGRTTINWLCTFGKQVNCCTTPIVILLLLLL